jgi:hypothetical protein
VTAPRVPLTVPRGTSGTGPSAEESEVAAYERLIGASRPAVPDPTPAAYVASQRDPARWAKVLDVSKRQGLAPEFVDRNLDSLTAHDERETAAYERLIAGPKTRGWLANPDNATVAKDALPELSYWERQVGFISDQFRSGRLQNELSDIGWRAFTGKVTAADRRRQAEIEGELGKRSAFGITGAIEDIPGVAAQQLPVMGRTLRAGLAGAGVAGAVGAVGGAVVGAASGLIAGGIGAVPAAGVGAMAGFKMLAPTGARLLAAGEAARMETAHAYLDYEKIRDDQGQPLDPMALLGAAALTGLANGALELYGLDAQMKAIPGLRAFTRSGVKRALASRTGRDAFVRAARTVGEAIAKEGATEGLQSLVTSTMGGFARVLSEQDATVMSPQTIIDAAASALAQAGSEAVAGAKTALVLGTAGQTVAVPLDYHESQRAQRNAAVLQALADGVAESELTKRLPEKTQDAIAALTRDGPVETVYVDRTAWDEYFQGIGLDPAEAATEVLGSADAYEEAVRTGAPIEMPTAVYATKVAASDVGQALADDLRIGSPAAKTPREARAYFESLDAETEAAPETAAATAADAARQSLVAQTAEALVSTGRLSQRDAEASATLYASHVATMAERMGTTVEAMAARLPLTIEGDPAGRGQPLDVRTMPLEELVARAEAFRERQVEREGFAAEETGPADTRDPYDLKEHERQADLRDAAGAFVYARTKAGTMRSNLGAVSAEGLVDELASLLRANEVDSRAAVPTNLEDVENSLGKNYVGMKEGAVRASGRMASRAKSIARVEAELQRRLGDRYKEALYARLAGPAFVAAPVEEDTSFDFAQPAYHGSPHVFDKFSLHAMGTGEGAQAYGWGLYFAGEKEVAKYYRNMLTGSVEIRIDGRDAWDVLRENEENEFGTAVGALMDASGVFRQAREFLEQDGDAAAAIAELDRLEASGRAEIKSGGRLYTVEIPNDETMLDWDRPLSEQPRLRRAIDALRARQDAGEWGVTEEGNMLYSKKELRKRTGADFYNAIARKWLGSPEAASRFLASLGINGIKFLDQGSRDAGRGTSNYVIFDDQLIEITEFEQRAPDENPQGWGSVESGLDPNYQAPNKGSRGVISIKRGPEGFMRAARITLNASANRSTFLHETGHFYLESLALLANDATAPGQIRTDYAEARRWLGLKDGESIQRTHHEQWARGTEAYLMEGRAPSAAMRSVFARFRSWLVAIYRNLAGLNVTLSPEIRRVMDRLIATDAEIAAAEAELQVAPLITDPAALGVSDAKAAAYNAAVEAARLTAQEQLSAQLMRDVLREDTAQYEAERERVRAEVAAQVNQEPASQALAILRTGKMPDGTELEEGSPLIGLKLSRDGIVEVAGGTGPLRRMTNLYRVAEGPTVMHPDQAAEWFGFATGAELVAALETAEPGKRRIDRLTDERMRAEYEGGELLTAEQLPDAAMKAVHNERRGDLLHRELEILAAANPRAVVGLAAAVVRTVPTKAAFREEARRLIASKPVREIRPILYVRAQAKANKDAAAALAKGDFAAAFEAKSRGVLNHELHRAATAALDEVESIVDYARTFGSTRVRQRIGKAGADYLEQIDALLDRYSFRRQSLAAVDRTAALGEWLEAKRQAKEPVPEIDPKLLRDTGRQHYTNTPLEELQAVRDAVQQIAHMARDANSLKKLADKQELDDAAHDVAGAIVANATKTVTQNVESRLPGQQAGRGLKDFLAWHRRWASLWKAMNGGQWEGGEGAASGAVHELLVRPLDEAGAAEASEHERAAVALDALFRLYTPQERAGFYTQRLVPGTEANPVALSKMGRLVVALNWGNEGNRARLRDGYRAKGWEPGTVDAILDTLDERDWRFVQGVWDFVDTYWERLEALGVTLTGLPPVKVEPSPFMTKFGQVEGGYYPISFDDYQAERPYQFTAEEIADRIRNGAMVRAQTAKGMLEARVKGPVDLPIRLDFGPLFDHVAETIHTVTHTETVLDLSKLLRHPSVRDAIYQHHGQHVYRALTASLDATTVGDVGATNAGERALGWLRTGAMIAGLGYNVSTALLQPLGLFNSMADIGPEWVGRGIARWVGSAGRMEGGAAWVHSKSDVMRTRHKTMTREVNEIRNTIGLSGGRLSGWMDAALSTVTQDRVTRADIADSFLWIIGAAQRVADIPTWLGAYEKALAQGADDATAVSLADRAVLDSQGGGQIKDLAGAQRGPAALRVWTTFYSYMNLVFNQLAEDVERTDFTRPASVGRLAADVLLRVTLPLTLGLMMKDALRGKADDEDDDFLAKVAKEHLAFAMGLLVGVRELSSIVSSSRNYEGPAGLRFFAGATRLGQQAKQGEADAAFWKALNATGGVLFHYPSGQVERTVRGIAALREGDTTNPLAVLLGPPKKDGR